MTTETASLHLRSGRSDDSALPTLLVRLGAMLRHWGPPPVPPKPTGLGITQRQWRRHCAFVMTRYGGSP